MATKREAFKVARFQEAIESNTTDEGKARWFFNAGWSAADVSPSGQVELLAELHHDRGKLQEVIAEATLEVEELTKTGTKDDCINALWRIIDRLAK